MVWQVEECRTDLAALMAMASRTVKCEPMDITNFDVTLRKLCESTAPYFTPGERSTTVCRAGQKCVINRHESALHRCQHTTSTQMSASHGRFRITEMRYLLRNVLSRGEACQYDTHIAVLAVRLHVNAPVFLPEAAPSTRVPGACAFPVLT